MSTTQPLRTLPKDEQTLALLLSLAYLGQLTRSQMSRLLCVSEGTIQRRLTQDADSLVSRGLVERLDQADYDHTTGTATRLPSAWQLTSAGIAHITHHEQFPANVLGKDEQFLARLNRIRKGTSAHDRQLAETIICLIEDAREHWCITGIFIRYEMKLNPFRRAPIADAVVILSVKDTSETPRHPLPFTRDKPVRHDDDGCVVLVLEMDMDTEPLATIQGKAIAYGQMIYDQRWEHAWKASFGSPFELLWVVPTVRRRDAVRETWMTQVPQMPFLIATFADVSENRWQFFNGRNVTQLMLFAPLPSLDEPAHAPPALPAGADNPEDAENLRRQARAEQQAREKRARAAEAERQRQEAARRQQEAVQRQLREERQRREAETRRRQTVHVLVQQDQRPCAFVLVQIGREERVLRHAFTDHTGRVAIQVESLDDTHKRAQSWWAVPDAHRRESLSRYRVGTRITVDVPPPPVVPQWFGAGWRVWHIWCGALGWLDTVLESGEEVIERLSDRAPAVPSRKLRSGVQMALELGVMLVMAMLLVALGSPLFLLLLGVMVVAGVVLFMHDVLRLALDALVWRRERLTWLAYHQREQQHWARFRAEQMQRQKRSRQQPTEPSRADFDRARRALRPRTPQRGTARVWMNVAAFVLLVLLGVWVWLGVWDQTPVSASIPAPPPATVAPAPTPTLPPPPTPPPLPTLPPAVCRFARVTSPALNVRDAPAGSVVTTLSEGAPVAVRCTPPVEQGGAVWVEIEPPPGVVGPAWVAQRFLADA